MSLLITKVKIIMTMATEHNSPTKVIHLRNLNPNADHTHHEQMLFITCTRVTMVTWIKCIISMMHAMVDVYCMDKAVVMEYQAAQEGIGISYRDSWVNTTCQKEFHVEYVVEATIRFIKESDYI